jgi:hypothetical protein
MEQLRELLDRTAHGLADMEHEANTLLSELDSLEARLHRGHNALSIDAVVAYLSIERKQMLEDEKRTETGASLAGFPALGIYALFSLFSGQRPNWSRAVSAAFAEEAFGDVRIAVSEDNIRLINVSKMARERDMTVAQVLAYVQRAGEQVLSWLEFESRAKKLRIDALKGEAAHLGIEKAGSEDIQALTTGLGGGGIVVS